MNTSIKLCGFKHLDDIIFASSLNINYLGMIFVQNLPRTIELQTAKKAIKICRNNDIKSVGVFIDQDASEIEKTLEKVDLDIIQLHGRENIEEYTYLNKDIIKTIHVSEDLLNQVSKLDFDNINYLLDATDIDCRGGTGNTFDWKILKDIPVEKLFIAGGLKPDNIRDLLDKYTPKCVDVSSGIEKKISFKDHKLMIDFVDRIRKYK